MLARTTICRRLAALAAAAVLGLAGCGSDDGSSDDGSPATSASSSTSAAAAPSQPPSNDAAMRPFTDSAGRTVDIPDQAQRIVALSDMNVGGPLLSLAAPVVGMMARDGGTYTADMTRYFDVDGIEVVGMHFEYNLELIARLEPDLIVGTDSDGEGMVNLVAPEVLDALEDIAPVVYINPFRPVEEVMADYAELLGGDASTKVAAQQAELDAKVTELRDVLGDRWSEATASVIWGVPSSGLYTWGPTSLVPLDLLSRVGVQWVSLMHDADAAGGSIDVSTESLEQLDADLVIVEDLADYDNSELIELPLFQALRGVQAGQILYIRERVAGPHFANYLFTAQLLIDELRSMGDVRTDVVE